MSVDFRRELEQIEAALQRRRDRLATITPDTPHPTCPCDRPWADHLREEISGLTALQEAMRGDFSRLLAQMQEFGTLQVQFSLSHVFAPALGPDEIMWRQMELSRKLLRASVPFKRLLELLAEQERNPRFDPRNN